MNEYNLNVIISKTDRNFNIIYDGQEQYYLFFNDEEIASITSDLTPKGLYIKYGVGGENRIKPSDFDNINDNKEIDTIIKSILEVINDNLEKANNYKVNVFDALLRSMKDSYTSKDKHSMIGYFTNAPANVKAKALELSELYDNENAPQTEIYTFDENDLTIEEQLKERANPTLTPSEREIASNIEKIIKKEGLIEYLNILLDDVHIGEHKNIHRKCLMLFTIMRGKASFLSETTAKAEAGKSFEDEIVFNMIAPARYVYKLSDVTGASFVRYSQISPYYFNRQTILFGDFGSKNSFDKISDVFNIFKELITEQEYIGSKSKKGENDWESNELILKVESIGGAYSTTLNSFTKDDNQLISRTLNSTPAPVDAKDVIEFLFYSDFSQSKQSKARDIAIEKLKEFGIYMMSLVNLDVEIINPYIDVFRDYALKSDNPIREYQQQKELFIAYCELTSYQCEKVGDYIIASTKQLEDYMNNINLENALIPYENDFLKMLMAKGKKYELSIISNIDVEELKSEIDDIQEKDYIQDVKDELIHKREQIINKMDTGELLTITECENNVIELLSEKYEGIEVKSDLTQQQLRNELPTKLNMLYGIDGRGSQHKGKKVFFRASDLSNIYGKRKAFENITNLPDLLKSLHNKGYLGRYEYRTENGYLYYLTPMCEDILTQFEPSKPFKQYWNEFSNKTGL